MTNDEAIKLLMSMKDGIIHVFDGDRMIALEMAISALEKQDAPGTNDGDLISRQAVINEALSFLVEYCGAAFDEDMQEKLSQRLRLISSAQPKTSTEIQEILNYLDTTLHPIVSPDNWYVYSELHDMVSMLPSAQPESTRTFVELVMRYPDPELCAYKEYKGKPYYSIKYIENGETHVGYGTYNPEVLSQYLKEYFISSVQPEIIRCKDCKYADEDVVCQNDKGLAIQDDDDFCSYAEREN